MSKVRDRVLYRWRSTVMVETLPCVFKNAVFFVAVSLKLVTMIDGIRTSHGPQTRRRQKLPAQGAATLSRVDPQRPQV